MKKILFLIMLSVAGLSAHVWHVYNHTPDSLSIKMNVIAGPDKNLTVAANSETDVNVGGYCLRAVEARGTAGSSVASKNSCEGKEVHFYKNATGYTNEVR